MKDNMYTIYIYGLTWFRLGLFFRKLKNPYTIGSMTELVQAKINNPLFTLGSKSSNDFGSTKNLKLEFESVFQKLWHLFSPKSKY